MAEPGHTGRRGRSHKGDPLFRLVAVLGVVAAALAPLLLHAAQFITLWLGGAFLGAVAALTRSAVGEQEDAAVGSFHGVARFAATGSVLVVTAGVFVTGFGQYGWDGVFVALLGYPILRRLARTGRTQQRRTTQTPRTSPLSAAESGTPGDRLLSRPLTDCSIAELAAAWTASHVLLQVSTSAASRARVAALRQRYLDEMERRDRRGVERWLASGPQPAEDPGHFLRG